MLIAFAFRSPWPGAVVPGHQIEMYPVGVFCHEVLQEKGRDDGATKRTRRRIHYVGDGTVDELSVGFEQR